MKPASHPALLLAVLTLAALVLRGETGAREAQGLPSPLYESFAGEKISYNMGFWFYPRAASGHIVCKRNSRGLEAEIRAETSGVVRLLGGKRTEVMQSTMVYDPVQKRLKPVVFQEVFSRGRRVRKKTVSFDYEKKTFSILLDINGRKAESKSAEMPDQAFDDPLTFLYNLRLGCYGEAAAGRRITASILVNERPSRIELTFKESAASGPQAGLYPVVMSLERNVTGLGTKRVAGWLSAELIPIKGVVEDAYFFGDLRVRLAGIESSQGFRD